MKFLISWTKVEATQVTSLRPKDSYGEEPNKHPDYKISSGDEAISIADIKEEIASSIADTNGNAYLMYSIPSCEYS